MECMEKYVLEGILEAVLHSFFLILVFERSSELPALLPFPDSVTVTRQVQAVGPVCLRSDCCC